MAPLQTSHSNLRFVGRRVFDYIRSNSKPGMINEFLSLKEKLPDLLRCYNASECGYDDICEFNRKYEVSFLDLYADCCKYGWEEKYLVTTSRADIVPPSVEVSSLLSFRSGRGEIAVIEIELIVPSIRYLSVREHSMPALLTDIIKEMRGGAGLLGGQASLDLAYAIPPHLESVACRSYHKIVQLEKDSPKAVTDCNILSQGFARQMAIELGGISDQKLPPAWIDTERAAATDMWFGSESPRAQQTPKVSSLISIKVPNNTHVPDIESATRFEAYWPVHILNIGPSSYDDASGPVSGKVGFNHSTRTETFLMIAAQASLTSWANGSSNNTAFSDNARILFHYAVACNIIGFICCLYAILLFRCKPGVNNVAARITTGIGYIASVYGFLALTGMLMPDNVMLQITGVACVASFPALAYAFIK